MDTHIKEKPYSHKVRNVLKRTNGSVPMNEVWRKLNAYGTSACAQHNPFEEKKYIAHLKQSLKFVFFKNFLAVNGPQKVSRPNNSSTETIRMEMID
jgi:hypothetical protein